MGRRSKGWKRVPNLWRGCRYIREEDEAEVRPLRGSMKVTYEGRGRRISKKRLREGCRSMDDVLRCVDKKFPAK